MQPRRIFIPTALALAAFSILLGSIACRGDVAATDQGHPNAAAARGAPAAASSHHQSEAKPIKPPALDPLFPEPQTEMERAIRHELSHSIEKDPLLRDREINFTVHNGDVSVTGLVRTETERQRINELAMAVPGVRSVANALRISGNEGGL